MDFEAGGLSGRVGFAGASGESCSARSDAARWDKKAAHYARFSAQMSPLHAATAAFARECGVVWRGASAVDFGCGTGVFCLHFARDLAALDAVDVSGEMLKILRADYEALRTGVAETGDNGATGGAENARHHRRGAAICELNTIKCTFSDFATPAKPYDIAMSTLSPALQTAADFERFDALARVKIFAGWAEHRRSSLLEGAFARFGRSNWVCACAALEEFLRARATVPAVRDFAERRSIRKAAAAARADVLWHLEINGFCATPAARAEAEAFATEHVAALLRAPANIAANIAERAADIAADIAADGYIIDEISTNTRIYIWR